MTTLCHLALSPGEESQKLVQLAAFHIFNMGYVYPEAWDSCDKDAKSSLAALMAENNYLFGQLLELNNHFLENGMLRDESTIVALWQGLQIEDWILSEQDVEILSQWLLRPVSGVFNETARAILFRLNYEELDHQMQKKIAWAIFRASRYHSTDNHFTKMCLNILCKLRLHLVDRNDVTLMDVPEVGNFEELGAAENSCTAAFLALETTSVGHFVPVIFTDGFKYVRLLYENGYHDAAFLCLDHLVSMFFDCPDSLTGCKDFIPLLGDILTSDRLLTKVVKFLSGDEAYGPVLLKFNAMLVNHLLRSGVEFLPKAVTLWVRVLTSLPLWQTCLQAVFILDSVCKQAFSNPPAWLQVLKILKEILPKAEIETPVFADGFLARDS